MFDGIFFFSTVSRTWSISRQAKESGIDASLSDLLLRDGKSLDVIVRREFIIAMV